MFAPRAAAAAASTSRLFAAAAVRPSRRSASSLVWIEHKRGLINPATFSAVTAAQSIGGDVRSGRRPARRRVSGGASPESWSADTRSAETALSRPPARSPRSSPVRTRMSRASSTASRGASATVLPPSPSREPVADTSSSCGRPTEQHSGPQQGLHLELAEVRAQLV